MGLFDDIGRDPDRGLAARNEVMNAAVNFQFVLVEAPQPKDQSASSSGKTRAPQAVRIAAVPAGSRRRWKWVTTGLSKRKVIGCAQVVATLDRRPTRHTCD